MGRRSSLIPVTVTIPNGTALSSAAATGGQLLAQVGMPAAWTAASLTFQASMDGVNWLDVWQPTAEAVQSGAGASRNLLMPVQLRAPLIRVRSGTSGVPVNQGADRVLTLFLVAQA